MRRWVCLAIPLASSLESASLIGVRLTSNCCASTSCFKRVPGGYSPVAILAWIRLARSSISFGEAAVFKTILPFFYEISRKADLPAQQAQQSIDLQIPQPSFAPRILHHESWRLTREFLDTIIFILDVKPC